MSDQTLRIMLNEAEFILVPRLHDMIAGVLANTVCFDVVPVETIVARIKVSCARMVDPQQGFCR